ncbi:mutarotase [Pontibacter diazotrophicus]|uniref:Mutarotase n=1 Tax=Pontibacter diazotrophicus TaxID=1400979 RepID=A0A3D8L8E1_9BACT|nr:2'-5' RNA ligase family protein [Pontibacter diazotrophicus]RDV13670.1 mutarotase [Pontibacter diazotrophicus]
MADETAPIFDLEKHYNQLWKDTLRELTAGAFELDPLIASENDSRFGVTLLFRPGQEVRKRIEQFLLELQQIEPEQYYYPEPDIHVTVMSVISCHAGFSLDTIRVEEYIQLVQKTIQNFRSFQLHFRGITASPSCLLIQGFPVADQLNHLRNKLRKNFRSATLQQTIDTRYVLQTAHSTVVRFKAPLQNASVFLDKVQEYREYDFGSTEVRELELVYNDWYQRTALVRLLGRFRLR